MFDCKLISIIIPVFNEQYTIVDILDRIKGTNLSYGIKKQIIIVNDCSTDLSRNYILDFIKSNSDLEICYAEHSKNLGKGASIKTALLYASGEIVLIQDADLEYSPSDYNRLIEPIHNNSADVVYGSRFVGAGSPKAVYVSHMMGNRFLTFLSNIVSGLKLTDMETGYKLFKTDVIKNVTLCENRFGIEPEITLKLCRIRNIRIYEIGIQYNGRTRVDGKKIKWLDGFDAVFCIIKYGIFKR